jgi:hypothetical protein
MADDQAYQAYPAGEFDINVNSNQRSMRVEA